MTPKFVLVIPDGMGDRPVAALGGKTPLEAARTPNMDFFARRGRVGLARTIPDGYMPGTDIGSMSLFGYDPRTYFTGRGPLEAAELGVELKAGELAFRCNLVTARRNLLDDFSADHISLEESAALIRDFDKYAQEKHPGRVAATISSAATSGSPGALMASRVRFYPGKGTGYRHLMILKDAPAAAAAVKFTAPHDIMGRPYRDYFPSDASVQFLVGLMEESRALFAAHPVNQRRRQNGKGEASMIWLWGQGFSPKFPTYFEKFGLRGGVITAVDLLKGIARYAGLDVIKVPGVTGYFDTNYEGKAEYAVNALKSRDFVVVHIESTDEAGHIGDPDLKIRAVEDVDRRVLGTLRRRLAEEYGAFRLLVVPDHYTCVESRTHHSDPVPFLIYDSQKEVEGPDAFSEKSAAQSGILVSEAHRLIEAFLRGEELSAMRAA